MYSVPEHITLAGLGAGLAGSAYPMIMATLATAGIPMPVRTLTGVPCPVLRTDDRDGRADPWSLGDRSRHQPAAVSRRRSGCQHDPILALRAAGAARLPRPWSAAARKRTRYAVLAIVAASWAFQLHRYGFL